MLICGPLKLTIIQSRFLLWYCQLQCEMRRQSWAVVISLCDCVCQGRGTYMSLCEAFVCVCHVRIFGSWKSQLSTKQFKSLSLIVNFCELKLNSAQQVKWTCFYFVNKGHTINIMVVGDVDCYIYKFDVLDPSA